VSDALTDVAKGVDASLPGAPLPIEVGETRRRLGAGEPLANRRHRGVVAAAGAHLGFGAAERGREPSGRPVILLPVGAVSGRRKSATKGLAWISGAAAGSRTRR